MEARINMMANALGARIGRRVYALHEAIETSPLPKPVQHLVMLRASQINGCGWCADLHSKEAAAEGESAVRLNLVATWRHAGVFTEPERAALRLTEEGTRLADDSDGVSEDTWAQARKHYDEDQMIALVSLVAMINAANRLGVILCQVGGAYEPGMLASMAAE